MELAALEHDRSILKAKLDRRMRELDAVLHNTLALEHAARSRMAENHQIHLDIRVFEDQIAQGNQRIAVAKAKAAQLQSQPIDLRPAVGYERYAKAEVRPRNGDWVLMDESGTRMGDDEIIYLDTHFDQMRDERWNVPLIWIAPNDSIANTSQKVSYTQKVFIESPVIDIKSLFYRLTCLILQSGRNLMRFVMIHSTSSFLETACVRVFGLPIKTSSFATGMTRNFVG